MSVCGRLLLCVVLLAVRQSVVGGVRFHLINGELCIEVDCRWGGWSGWGACNHPCGNAGTQHRHHSVSRNAKCYGDGCSGPSTATRPCNRFCVHGTPQNGYCSDCPAEFWGTCCDRRELDVIYYL